MLILGMGKLVGDNTDKGEEMMSLLTSLALAGALRLDGKGKIKA